MTLKDDQGNHTSNIYSKPDMNYLFSVAIGDKASFQKLIDAGKNITGPNGRQMILQFLMDKMIKYLL